MSGGAYIPLHPVDPPCTQLNFGPDAPPERASACTPRTTPTEISGEAWHFGALGGRVRAETQFGWVSRVRAEGTVTSATRTYSYFRSASRRASPTPRTPTIHFCPSSSGKTGLPTYRCWAQWERLLKNCWTHTNTNSPKFSVAYLGAVRCFAHWWMLYSASNMLRLA